MKPLETINTNNKHNPLPKTIEQKLEEAIQDFETDNLYTEEEIWNMMSEKYGFKL